MQSDWTIIESLLVGMTRGWIVDRDVRSTVRGITRVADDDSLRSMSVGIILELIRRDYAYPVFWDASPWFIEPAIRDSWEGNAWDAIARIDRLWWERRDNDEFLDIVWFGPTAKGHRLGQEIIKRG